MMRKIFNGRTWALVALVVALFTTAAPLAQAREARYFYTGTLVEVQDRNITIINDADKSVVHAVVPGNIHMQAGFNPGDVVAVTLTKTNIGIWNLKSIKKVK